MASAEFQETSDFSWSSQEAVFRCSVGGGGGMGEAVLAPGTRSIRFIEGLPVFVDPASHDQLTHRVGPACSVIRVRARIHLQRRMGPNPIYGTPREKHAALVIEELHECSIEA